MPILTENQEENQDTPKDYKRCYNRLSAGRGRSRRREQNLPVILTSRPITAMRWQGREYLIRYSLNRPSLQRTHCSICYHKRCKKCSSEFNGATTFRSWKHSTIKNIGIVVWTLQWSHDLSIMETGVNSIRSAGAYDASMEP